MNIFDKYVFKNLLFSSVLVSIILAIVILLTQSLRFLELVVESGASSSAFWVLTLLALPRFFEVIVPLSLMAATLFVYNRMTMDSELIVIRSVGYSPLAVSRPALILSLMITVFLWGVTLWGAPKALSHMQSMQHVIKSQFSSLLFREGVFNQAGRGLTIYIRERTPEGEMRGLMIHDSRAKERNPSTIMAQHGVIVTEEDQNQVLVYDGARQEYDPKTQILHRLKFDRYTIDLPGTSPIKKRWAQPDERSLGQLLHPDMDNPRDRESIREFYLELHRRIVAPLLAPVFCLIACCALVIGPVDRRGQTGRIALAIISAVVIQGLFLTGFNLARHSNWGLVLIYTLIFVPMGLGLFLLSGLGEHMRRRMLYTPSKKESPTS